MEGGVSQFISIVHIEKTLFFFSPPDLERNRFNLLFLGVLLLWVGSLIFLTYIVCYMSAGPAVWHINLYQ